MLLTGVKNAAQAAETFVCIADSTKQGRVLGAFPLPVEGLRRESLGLAAGTLRVLEAAG